MVSWNLPHGSDVHRDGRWYQLQAANTHYYETQSPKTALLFQENVSDMHEELVMQAVQFPGEEEDRDVEVWNYLKATQPFEKTDRRCCFDHFLSSVATPQECLKSWARIPQDALGNWMQPFEGKEVSGSCDSDASEFSRHAWAHIRQGS